MDSKFLQAVLAQPPAGDAPASRYSVMGVRLRRFTHWHLCALHAVLKEQAIAPTDATALCWAAVVCSTRPDRLTTAITRIGKRGFPWRMRWARHVWMQELRHWHTYLDAYFSVPRIRQRPGGGEMQSPWAFAGAVQLMRMGRSYDEAMLSTPALGRWISLTARELAGEDIGLVTPAIVNALRAAGYDVSDLEE